jgi:hypothetical protein
MMRRGWRTGIDLHLRVERRVLEDHDLVRNLGLW